MNNNNINRNILLTNFLWRFFERMGTRIMSLFVTVVLARLLLPSDFGIIALITVFTNILQVFIDSGMGNALIQKKDTDELDFSSVFVFNMVVCLILYVVLFFTAPFIAGFYNLPKLTLVIRILGLTLIISGLRNIQQAYISRHLLFKNLFYATLGSTFVSAVVSIWMAYIGFGIWALVTQNLLNAAIGTAFLWKFVQWHPKLLFSFQRIKLLFSFGWKLLVSALLDTGYNNITSLIIGKLYTSSDLAFFDRGVQFPSVIVTNINNSIDSVLFPSLSALQDDRTRVRSMTRRAIKTSTYLLMPFMMGLAVCAVPIVKIILTEKWLPCVFFMRIFCFIFAFYPIHTANLNAIKAMGRSDLFLILEIVKKIIGLLALFVTMYISLEAMAFSLLVTSILSQIINSWPNRKLLDYHYIDQVKDMLPQITLSCIMGLVVFNVQYLFLNVYLTLLIQILVAAIVYIGGSWLFRIDSFEYVLEIAKIYKKK